MDPFLFVHSLFTDSLLRAGRLFPDCSLPHAARALSFFSWCSLPRAARPLSFFSWNPFNDVFLPYTGKLLLFFSWNLSCVFVASHAETILVPFFFFIFVQLYTSGAEVTGVDSVGEGLPVARAHAAAMGLNVEYMQKTVSTVKKMDLQYNHPVEIEAPCSCLCLLAIPQGGGAG